MASEVKGFCVFEVGWKVIQTGILRAGREEERKVKAQDHRRGQALEQSVQRAQNLFRGTARASPGFEAHNPPGRECTTHIFS